jgi:putative membrane protein
MTLRWVVATLHLLALPLGLGAIWARARALRELRGPQDLRRVFLADNLWGLAALLWIATGVARAFAGLEKGTAFYLGDRAFQVKLALFALIFALEVRPMTALIRWRLRLRRGAEIDLAPAAAFARTSWIQTALVVAMVFAATALARGTFR